MFKKIALQVFLALLLLEGLLRVLHVNQTFQEAYKGEYEYFFGQARNTWYHTWPANYDLEFGEDEFTFFNHYNDLGHREVDFSEFKADTSDTKIVCLGDSFTEGDGAPYDSSWVRILETEFKKIAPSTAVYNAGVCGSDALFDHAILRDTLLSAQPQIVIQCLNNSDITDIYYRGGTARFREDGTFKAAEPRKWEVFFKYSYLFRALLTTFTSYDRNLVNQHQLHEDEQKALEILATQVNETYNLCKENDIFYTLVILPVPGDVNYWLGGNSGSRRDSFALEMKFAKLPNYLNPEVPVINLFQPMFDTFESVNVEAYSWERNGHYNSDGYEIVGQSIFKALQDSIMVNAEF